MDDTEIAGNNAWLGGGVAMGRDSRANFTASTFTGNFARMGGSVLVSQNKYDTKFDRCTMSQNSAQFSELHSVQDEDIVGDSLISGWFHSGFTDKPAPMHLKALQDKFGGKNAVKYLAHPKIWTSKRDATEMQRRCRPDEMPLRRR